MPLSRFHAPEALIQYRHLVWVGAHPKPEVVIFVDVSVLSRRPLAGMSLPGAILGSGLEGFPTSGVGIPGGPQVRVADAAGEWTVSRRFRNFETLHLGFQGSQGFRGSQKFRGFPRCA